MTASQCGVPLRSDQLRKTTVSHGLLSASTQSSRESGPFKIRVACAHQRSVANDAGLSSSGVRNQSTGISSLKRSDAWALHGVSKPPVFEEAASPFTEHQQGDRERSLGGIAGLGETSSSELDPLLPKLREQSVDNLVQQKRTSSWSDPFFSHDNPHGLEPVREVSNLGSNPDRNLLEGSSGKGQSADDAENDISLRLPELRELLGYLRNAAQRSGQIANGGGQLGKVFLVGTGPGDPDLLTVKAWRLLQTADLVLYDRLISRDVLDMIHPGARLLYVGKAASYHSRTQGEIHALLLSFAEAGAMVVRLKGGDPLVFGRGGEEIEYLQQHGVQVDIVPGITSASGISASLGIPLTHRGLANSVRFLTGHTRKGGEDHLHVAESAADPDSTLVIYMGLSSLRAVVSKLVANGLPAGTPAVAVERGTTEWQRNVFAVLEDLPDAVAEANLISPTLIVIGQVVSLSHHWPYQDTGSDELNGGSGDSAPDQQDRRDRRFRHPDPLLPSERMTRS